MEKDDILDCLNGQANVFRGVNCTIHLNRILVLRPKSDSLFNFLTTDQSRQEEKNAVKFVFYKILIKVHLVKANGWYFGKHCKV